MAHPELGTKRICGECDAKFYDLNRSPAVCPKCGYTLTAKKASATPVAKPAKAAKVEKEPVKVAAAIEDDENDLDEESLDEIALVTDVVDVAVDEADEELDEPVEKDVFIETDDDDENVTDLIEGVSTKPEDN